MKRPGGTLLLAVVPVVLTVGCSGGEDSAPVSTIQPLPSETSMHEEAAQAPTAASSPAIPAAAHATDAAGAVAFARHWFDLAEYAYATGDTAPMMALAGDACSACSSIGREIDGQYRGGGAFEGVDITIQEAVAAPPDDYGTVVSLLYSESASRTVSQEGGIKEEIAAVNRGGIEMYLEKSPTGWRVFDIADAE